MPSSACSQPGLAIHGSVYGVVTVASAALGTSCTQLSCSHRPARTAWEEVAEQDTPVGSNAGSALAEATPGGDPSAPTFSQGLVSLCHPLQAAGATRTDLSLDQPQEPGPLPEPNAQGTCGHSPARLLPAHMVTHQPCGEAPANPGHAQSAGPPTQRTGLAWGPCPFPQETAVAILVP